VDKDEIALVFVVALITISIGVFFYFYEDYSLIPLTASNSTATYTFSDFTIQHPSQPFGIGFLALGIITAGITFVTYISVKSEFSKITKENREPIGTPPITYLLLALTIAVLIIGTYLMMPTTVALTNGYWVYFDNGSSTLFNRSNSTGVNFGNATFTQSYINLTSINSGYQSLGIFVLTIGFALAVLTYVLYTGALISKPKNSEPIDQMNVIEKLI
jgi:hypothetical protein